MPKGKPKKKKKKKPFDPKLNSKGKPRKRTLARPKPPALRDEILAFISEEISQPNNVKCDIDFYHPDGLDDDIAQAVTKYKIKRDRVGRPTKMTIPVLQKLKLALTIGCTDAEACQFAGISVSTLHNFQKEYKEFLELKEKWKSTEVVAARLNVFQSVVQNKNMEDSWRSLRAKRKDEFAEKSISEHQNSVSTDELQQIAQGEVEEMEVVDVETKESEEESA